MQLKNISFLIIAISIHATSSAQNNSRLRARTYLSYNSGTLEMKDSAHYYYSGNNGWDWRTGGWKYDNSMSWKMNGGNLEESYRFTNSFDGSNRISVSKKESKSSGSWSFLIQSDYTYNSSSRVAEELITGSSSKSRYVYTYDGSNRIIEKVSQNWNSGTGSWDNNTRYINSYNSNNLPEIVLTQQWDKSAGNWRDAYRITYTYSGLNLVSELRENNGSPWTNSLFIEYSYSGGNMTVKEEKTWNGSNWDPSWKTTYTYNTANEQTGSTLQRYDFGGYANIKHYDYQHARFNRISLESSSSWNSASGVFEHQNGDYEIRYYYDDYTESVVPLERVISVQLFPMPAHNNVNIQLNNRELQLIQVSVFDMTSKSVDQFVLPSQSSINYIYDASRLNAGNYIIQFSGNTFHETKMLSVQR